MRKPIYGLVAEFDTAEELIKATEEAYHEGYRKFDGFSPFPIEEVAEGMHFHRTAVPAIVFVAGITGAFGGFMLQVIGNAWDYPINVGGRPLISWQSFVPITFESTILLAAFSAVLSMLLLNGFPKPYQPVFNTPNFDRASEDGFFLCIEAADPMFESGRTRQFLQQLNPLQVSEVEY